jgi:spermidine synthase
MAGYRQQVEVRARLGDEQSRYQHVQVLDTAPFGRMLILDDAVQTTVADEAAYHEMLVHVPMLAHPNPLNVLIIGGGDGGTLRRVLQHPVRRALQVEIDEAVIRLSRELLPEISDGAYDDDRVDVIVADGVAFLESHSNAFDVVLIDSTDPIGPAEGLFARPFYESVRRALRSGGVMASHCGSPVLMAEGWLRTIGTLEGVFDVVEPYLTYVPAYPAGLWGMVAASASRSVRRPEPSRLNELSGGVEHLTYYTPELHAAAFALPASLARRMPLFPIVGSAEIFGVA